MATTTKSKKVITLRSSDGEEFEFEIEGSVAKEFQMIKHMILSKSDEKTADEELKAMECIKSKDTPKTKEKSAHEEEEDDENGVPAEDDEPENSESKENEFESEEEPEDDKEKDPEEKSSGKKEDEGEGKSKESGESGPSMVDLRLAIYRFVRNIDLNKVTFADMLEHLCACYGIDLTPRKDAIKLMALEELAILIESEVNSDFENDDGFLSDDE